MSVIKIGDLRESKNYGRFEVIARTPGKITIKFVDTGYTCTYDKNQVRKGDVKDCMARIIYGVGFYGDGSFTKDKPKELVAKALESWHSMFKRCYDERLHKLKVTYKDCTVSNDWHNFQSYAKFYIEDAYRLDGWELDKDLLVKGNRLYSPSTCVYLPRDINGALKTNNTHRSLLPIGVFKCSSGGFKARCRDHESVQVILGKFTTENEAFHAYKCFKESVIKRKALDWKDSISPLAYKALMEYCVEITD